MKNKFAVKLLTSAMTTLLLITPALADDKLDTDIELAAANSHVFKTWLKADDIKVDVKDGAATLSGEVMEDFHKALAEQTVASLPGVKSVDNKLDVAGEFGDALAGKLEAGAEERSDRWLEAKVRTTLFFHNNVSAATEVAASNGVLVLSGSANSQAEKELTTEYAADVEGVKSVENHMLVLATPKNPRTLGEKIDDTSITAAVKMILLSHRSTSAIRTNVDTRDGVVNLTGEAKNEAEISLVSKLVSDANGVNRVNNAMTVKRSN